MKPLFKHVSYRFSILQALLPIMVISIAVISVNFAVGSTRAVVELSDQVVGEISRKMIERTVNYVESGGNHGRVLSHLTQNVNVAVDHEKVWSYFWGPMVETPQVQSIFVGDRAGNYVQVRREPVLATRLIDTRSGIPVETTITRDERYAVLAAKTNPTDWDPRTRPWYKNTGKERKLYWSDVFVFTTAKTPGVSASFPLLDNAGEISGVLAVNIPLHSLSDFVAEQKVLRHGLVFITNERGEVIAFPDKKIGLVVEESKDTMRLLRVNELANRAVVDAFAVHQSEKIDRVTSKTDGEKYISTFIPFPSPFEKMKIGVVIPEDDILASIHRMETIAILISVIVLAAVLFVVYQISRRISQPIIALSREMLHIKDFKLDEVKPVESRIHEIQEMNHALITAVEGLQSFRKYVPASFVRQLITSGKKAELGGVKAEITILFCDIEGFTSFSENMPAEDLMIHLSDYLNELSQIILEEKGTIDKFIGDAIMVFWGQPVEMPDAPERACRTALRCTARLAELNQRWQSEGKPTMNTRFGIHTGFGVVGNVGSAERMNYSVIGDSVNLTSRLEGTNKLYGTRILISQSTFEKVQSLFLCRLLDIVTVKGRSKGVQIYELIGKSDEKYPSQTTQFVLRYEQAFRAYLAKNWDGALDIFEELAKENPSDLSCKLLLKRCLLLKEDASALPHDWDGTTSIR